MANMKNVFEDLKTSLNKIEEATVEQTLRTMVNLLDSSETLTLKKFTGDNYKRFLIDLREWDLTNKDLVRNYVNTMSKVYNYYVNKKIGIDRFEEKTLILNILYRGLENKNNIAQLDKSSEAYIYMTKKLKEFNQKAEKILGMTIEELLKKYNVI